METLALSGASPNGSGNSLYRYYSSPITWGQFLRLSTIGFLIMALFAYGLWKYAKIDAQTRPPSPGSGYTGLTTLDTLHRQIQDDRIDAAEKAANNLKDETEQNRKDIQTMMVDISTMHGMLIGFGAAITLLQILGLIAQIKGIRT